MIIQRPGQRIHFVPGIGINVITPMSAAVTSWWLSGGISAANCIAAYAAKGAASYANSKINLANPGTYNAVEAPNAPNWSATRGWYRSDNTGELICNGLSIPCNQTWTLIVFGMAGLWWSLSYYNSANGFGVGTNGASLFIFRDGGAGSYAGIIGTAAVLAVSGGVGYVNGVPVVSGMVAGTTPTQAYAYGSNSGNPYADVYAEAWYTPLISAAQIAAVSTAMAAL